MPECVGLSGNSSMGLIGFFGLMRLDHFIQPFKLLFLPAWLKMSGIKPDVNKEREENQAENHFGGITGKRHGCVQADKIHKYISCALGGICHYFSIDAYSALRD